jgi:hypothetical protein
MPGAFVTGCVDIDSVLTQNFDANRSKAARQGVSGGAGRDAGATSSQAGAWPQITNRKSQILLYSTPLRSTSNAC